MEREGHLRQVFTPAQPAVSSATAGVTYRELHPDLQACIYCYWELKTTRPLVEPFWYWVVADSCMDIFFACDSPEESYGMGFCKNPTEFPLEKTFHYTGIRFLPSGFPQIFQIPASLLSNRFERLDQVVPGAAAFLAHRIQRGQDLEALAGQLDHYLLEQLYLVSPGPDRRFYDALLHIVRNQGLVNVEKDLVKGLSPRQLRRYFNHYIGDTPKTFSKVVRF